MLVLSPTYTSQCRETQHRMSHWHPKRSNPQTPKVCTTDLSNQTLYYQLLKCPHPNSCTQTPKGKTQCRTQHMQDANCNHNNPNPDEAHNRNTIQTVNTELQASSINPTRCPSLVCECKSHRVNDHPRKRNPLRDALAKCITQPRKQITKHIHATRITNKKRWNYTCDAAP